MSVASDLLQTAGGIKLCPEIILKVAEELIAAEPEAINSLLHTSKSLYTLLKTYEKSICASILKRDPRLAWVNVDQPKVLSSQLPLGSSSVTKYTYPWVVEMRSRVNTVEFLVRYDLTDMIDHHAQNWPTLDVPKAELCQRVTLFKRFSFSLLFKLADCTAGLQETLKIRAKQAEFLDSLTIAGLASLGVIVEVMGQNYFTMTKSALDKSNPGDVRPSSPAPLEWFFAPNTVDAANVPNDNWIRECMCVFEDLIQRFGPHFPYIFLKEGKDRLLDPAPWARRMLQDGLHNMNAFELGYTMSFASLQSVVWNVFCRKEKCSPADRWMVAKEVVENEMQSYEIVDEE
ncbi:hypothetical protein BDZ45DRAFT_777 [Acephala macrosclerotiorum]|nr:hypothetical protein BDZ45DRAFT_777 [Acephala macrosclerotiorum]